MTAFKAVWAGLQLLMARSAIAKAILELSVIIRTMIFVTWAWNVAVTALKIALGIGLITAIIGLFVLIYRNWDTISAFFVGVFEFVVAKISEFITWLSTPSEEFIAAWMPIQDFFSNLWDNIMGILNQAIDEVMQSMNVVASSIRWLLGAEDKVTRVASKVNKATEDMGLSQPQLPANLLARANAQQPQVISPQARIGKSLVQSRAEVTIRDETNRAEVTGGRLGEGLRLQRTGAF